MAQGYAGVDGGGPSVLRGDEAVDDCAAAQVRGLWPHKPQRLPLVGLPSHGVIDGMNISKMSAGELASWLEDYWLSWNKPLSLTINANMAQEMIVALRRISKPAEVVGRALDRVIEQRDRAESAIAEHNAGCDAACDAQRPNERQSGCGFQRHDGSKIYSKRCSTCPKDWIIHGY